MQAPPALTSQWENAGPIETTEIPGCAKVRRRAALFEFGRRTDASRETSYRWSSASGTQRDNV